ncbi:MAG: hypothetical protein SOT34_02115, partial [Candidatus Borkfalkiaceae bacterium]|nr:hypothetical protein [Christensenellaceae bacterium]
MKKIVCLLLILSCAFFSVSCKRGGDSVGTGGDEEAKKVTIIVSSGEISAKSDDAYVKKTIEDKFFADRGKRIDLDVQVYSEKDFNDVMANRMASGKWDAAVGYIGQAGIDEIVISQNVCMEIGGMISLYSDLSALVSDELTATTTIDGSVWGVPSLELTNQYGVLIRADYMERVGYTLEEGYEDDLGPVDSAPAGKRRTLKTIADFEDMMYRMKAQIKELSAPLSAYPWDLESTLTVGPFSDSGYTFKVVEGVREDGSATSVVPGQIAESYYRTLATEYKWSRDGLWEEECYTGHKDKKLQAFIQGKTAIYAVDPEITNLISVARKCKAANPSATFAVPGPLYGVDEEGN